MNEQSQNNPYTIPLSILIAGLLIAGAVVYSGNGKLVSSAPAQVSAGVDDAAQPKAEENGNLAAVRPIGPSDHILGNPSAPVKIIEYSDLQCPFCARFHVVMKQAMDEFGKEGKIAWIYRHFPLDQIHEHARLGAQGAECAQEFGGVKAFWDFVDTVFAKQGEGLSKELFLAIADKIGLDKTTFDPCLSSETYKSAIDADVENALASGGQGTPYSIIIAPDGTRQVVNGAVPYTTLKSQIEQALGSGK